MKKKKILIFFQSLAEITEIFKILSKNKFGSCIIIVTGGKNFIPIIEKLKLKKKFGVIIYPFYALSLKNPFNILAIYYKFYFSNNTKKILSYYYQEAIFFNKFFDFITPFFLCKINVKKISYIDFYKFEFSKPINIGFKNTIKKIILKSLYKKLNLNIYFFKLNFQKEIVLYFHMSNIVIKNKSREKKYNIPLLSMDYELNKKKKVIYLDSNEEEYLVSMGEYDIGKIIGSTVTEVLKVFEKDGYDIIIKKHSRARLSPSLSKIKNWTYILDPLPIEIYSLNKLDIVVAYCSSGLALVSQKKYKIKTVSIIKLIPSKVYTYKNAHKYYNHLSRDNKIYYPENLNQIKNLIISK
jgi:hypothetical protein